MPAAELDLGEKESDTSLLKKIIPSLRVSAVFFYGNDIADKWQSCEPSGGEYL